MRAPASAALGRAAVAAAAAAAAAAACGVGATASTAPRLGHVALAIRSLSSAVVSVAGAGRAGSLCSLGAAAASPTPAVAARPHSRDGARLTCRAAGCDRISRGYAADAARSPGDADAAPSPSGTGGTGGGTGGQAPPRRVGAASTQQQPSPASSSSTTTTTFSPRPLMRPPRRGGGADGGAGAHAATAWRSRGGAGGPLAFLAKTGSARPKRPAVDEAWADTVGVSRPRAVAAVAVDELDDHDGDALGLAAAAAPREGGRVVVSDDADAGDDADDDDDTSWADCGPAFPFTARAFYVGRRAEGCLARLRSTAAAEGLDTVWDEPSSVMFRLGPADGRGGGLDQEGVSRGGGGGEAASAAATAGTSSAAPAAPAAPAPADAATPGLDVTDQYVAVFAPMGAVVFFNTPGGGGDAEAALWARLTAGGRLTCGEATHADDVRLLVAPGLDAPTRVAGDALILRHPGTSVIKTVACVAAQTVALHFYEAQVDADLERFRGANASMAATGSFKAGTSKEALLKAVARNNVLMATIMGGGAGAAADPYTTGAGSGKKKKGGGSGGGSGSGGGGGGGGGGGSTGNGGVAALPDTPTVPATTRGDAIGIMSRLDVAWHDPTCAAVYDHLRDDLEIDGRLATLGAKLTFVQDNLKYFLEIMQNKKSDTLEWTIIVLIAAEIGVSLYDLFFKGAA